MARLGGGIGCWLGMLVFHHKKNHTKFRNLVPIWIVIWMFIIVFIVILGSGNLMNGIEQIKEMREARKAQLYQY